MIWVKSDEDPLQRNPSLTKKQHIPIQSFRGFWLEIPMGNSHGFFGDVGLPEAHGADDGRELGAQVQEAEDGGRELQTPGGSGFHHETMVKLWLNYGVL